MSWMIALLMAGYFLFQGFKDGEKPLGAGYAVAILFFANFLGLFKLIFLAVVMLGLFSVQIRSRRFLKSAEAYLETADEEGEDISEEVEESEKKEDSQS